MDFLFEIKKMQEGEWRVEEKKCLKFNEDRGREL